jgi:Ca2+-binding RTX toxin-like protein
MVTFNRSDLEFVLTQIQQAEAGQPPVNPHLAFGLREVAGTNNNAVPGQADFGSADQPFPTQTTEYFRTVTVNIDGTVFDPNPGVAGDTMTTTYASSDPGGIVVDTAPRTISNLISDISTNNPAAVQAAQNFGAQLGDGYTVMSSNPTGLTLPGADGVFGTADDVLPADPANLFIGNITPDSGLSAPFNSWMTFFGQFFDHGLDLITKGGNGTVFIPLLPGDPLYVEGSPTNFMVLTRATDMTVSPGPDGILGTSDDIHQNINTTTPFVDQNQTYTSHPSHQVFLREYMTGSDTHLHSTGKLLMHAEGADGVLGTADDNSGMATWADVKANALKLGIALTDYNAGNVPLLATDAYGNFIPGAHGFAQVVVRHADGTTTLVEGTAAGLDLTHPDPSDPAATVVYTGHAFINDMAHTASPFDDFGHALTADADSIAGNPVGAGFYDDELLDAHYIAGDGRANENIALTTVHTIFHDEHNRLIEQVKDLIRGELANGDTSFALNWVLPGANLADGIQDNEWNGERLFQVAKFGTETQYQHLVFEEFARKIAPTIHLFGNTDIHLDPAIVSEFANAVYRFGHSMLDENVPIFQLNPDGTPVIGPDGQPVLTDMGLIEAFTNPLAFAAGGADMAAQIVQGTTHQIGSEIDEFVTGALRNNLLGLPLDLAALNIARGRDTGVAPLNLVRNEIFSQTHDTALKPYESWDEFRQFLKHDASIVNFLAAYGTHASITSATTLEAKRAAALDLVTMGADPASQTGDAIHQDAYNFMHSLGAYANDLSNPLAVHAEWSTGSITGLDNVDLWIGGLAEKQNLFGGLLGSTFNFIFETQLESLQDGDRLYYLPRIEGTHWGSEIEGNTFASMIMLNTGAKHLPASIFLTPEYTVEASDYFQKDASGNFLLDANGHRIATDPSTWLHNPVTGAQLVEVLADGTVHFIGDDNFFGNTMVLGGTEGDDRLMAGNADDDTVWGDGGNDFIDGGNGNDQLFGGAGDDTISDTAGLDIIHGDAGNDTVSAGIGDDTVFGGDGNDYLDGGQGIDVIVGGLGNDIILGGEDDDELEGNEGDDWIEGGNGGDLLIGDQGAPTGQVPLIQGNDVLDGGAQGDRMQGFSGDDIMLGQGGFDKFEGRLGYDWASWENEDHGVSVDMTRREFIDNPAAPGGDAIRDFFIDTEAASGSRFGDFIQGTNNSIVDTFNELTNVNLITGLADYFPEGPVAFSNGNILFGGGGSDFLEGRGGNDIIDGDARLHVALTSHAAGGQIIREILYDQAQGPTVDEFGNVIATGDIDTAVFSDAFANYQIELATNPDGSLIFGTDGNIALRVTHIPPVAGGGGGGGGGGGAAAVINDGVDTLYNIERLQFSDVTIDTGFFTGALVSDRPAEGTISINNPTPLVGSPLFISATTINDFEGVLVNGVLDPATAGFSRIDIPLNELQLQWQVQDLARGDWVNIEGATGPAFIPTDFQVGEAIRVQATFIDGLGVKETVFSAPTAVVATNPIVNHAPTVVAQVAQPGLPDTTAHEDTPLGTASRPGIFLPLITTFTDDTTPANQLVYTATLANGQPLETMGLTFAIVPDAVGLVAGARITGTPPADFAGPIEVRVKATDAGGLSVTDSFIINVLPSNDGHADLSISGTAEQGQTLTALLGPDPDGPGTTPLFQWLRDGVAVGSATNATTFTLGAADVGHAISVKATYVDGQGFAEAVTSAPTGPVAGSANAAPIVAALGAAAGENGPITADLLAGAADPESAPLSVVGLDAAVTTAGGRALALGTDFTLTGSTLALTAVGLAKFDSLPQGGQDSAVFHFGVSDGVNTTANTLTLTINGVNDAPSTAAAAETNVGTEDQPISGVLLPGSDPEGSPLTFKLVAGSAANGSVTIDANTGAYIFTPAANFAGAASFAYVVNDGAADSAAKTVSLTVAPVDDGAASLTISGVATEGQTLTALLGADPDGVGGAASFQWLRDGVAITGATGSTLALGTDDIGHAISVTADYTDGQGFADHSASAQTAAVQALPGITLTGTNGANTLTGTAGADTINGLGGNDTLNGLGGNDVLNGGAGNDTINAGAGNDTITGGTGADRLFGDIGDDHFIYTIGDGVDTIDGGAGFDTLHIFGTAGGNTLDVIFNGTALTQFEGGTLTGVEAVIADLLGGADRLSYAGTTSGVSVDLAAGTASGFTSIAGIENVTGGSGADTFRGNALANNFAGGAGNDTYFVGAGDTITEGAGGGADSVFTNSASFTLSANVENLTFTGAGNFTGTGNGSSNVITGGVGNDILSGGNGADTLIGGSGVDTLNGGSGNDILNGGIGDDIMSGGTGNDMFVFASGFGHDTITGFDANPGGGGQDLLDLMAYTITAADFAARVSIVDLGANTMVTIDGADSILLVGVNGVGANTITEADFIHH